MPTLKGEEREIVLETIRDIIGENQVSDEELRELGIMSTTKSPGGGVGVTLPAEIEVTFQRGLASAGGAENFARQLYHDNFEIRADNRELKGKLPEGSIVLTKEEAEAWEVAKTIGKAKDIQAVVEENTRLKSENATAKRDALLRGVAEAPEPGIRFDFDVLKELDGKLTEVSYEKKELVDTKTGVKVAKWVAIYKDGDTKKETPVLELFKEKFPKFLPALQDLSTQQTNGNFYPELGGGGQVSSPTDQSIGQSYVANRYGHNAPQKAS